MPRRKSLPVYRVGNGEYGLNVEVPDVYDSSMLRDFVACPSKFYHKHILGLRPSYAERKIYFDWGNLWHLLHFHFGKHEDVQAALDLVDEMWPQEHGQDDRHGRHKERIKLLFMKYLDQYHSLDTKEWELLRREQYFEIHCKEDDPDCPFGGCGFSWCGRLDRIQKNKRTGKVVVWDYKTTSYLRDDYFEKKKHGFQIPGYVWASEHLIPSEVVGAQIDLLHTLKSDHSFIRQEIRLTDAHLLEWLANVKQYVLQIEHFLEEYSDIPEAWPKNWGECHSYGNPCMFWGVHSMPPKGDSRARLLSQDYEEDRWDPSEMLEVLE